MSDSPSIEHTMLGPIACHPAVRLRQRAANEPAVTIPESFGNLAPQEVMQFVFSLLGARRPSLQPLLADYGLYDQLLYFLMTHDQGRNRQYQRALELTAPGKVVLDIGTGRDLNWALAALEAGASKVYAIEVKPESCEVARQTIAERKLEDTLILLQGVSTELSLPEPVDVCVSEIVGCIGSSEGMLPVLADARKRFLKPDGVMIPDRCTTVASLYGLPTELRARPGLESLAAYYASQVFNELGRAFDLRLVIDDHEKGQLLSPAAEVELLELSHIRELAVTQPFQLHVSADGLADGLLCSIQLSCHPETDVIDSLAGTQAWVPAFLPLFSPAVEVRAGDILEATWHTDPSKDGLHPDYRVIGTLRRPGRDDRAIDFRAPFFETRLGSNPLYQGLFQTPAE